MEESGESEGEVGEVEVDAEEEEVEGEFHMLFSEPNEGEELGVISKGKNLEVHYGPVSGIIVLPDISIIASFTSSSTTVNRSTTVNHKKYLRLHNYETGMKKRTKPLCKNGAISCIIKWDERTILGCSGHRYNGGNIFNISISSDGESSTNEILTLPNKHFLKLLKISEDQFLVSGSHGYLAIMIYKDSINVGEKNEVKELIRIQSTSKTQLISSKHFDNCFYMNTDEGTILVDYQKNIMLREFGDSHERINSILTYTNDLNEEILITSSYEEILYLYNVKYGDYCIKEIVLDNEVTSLFLLQNKFVLAAEFGYWGGGVESSRVIFYDIEDSFKEVMKENIHSNGNVKCFALLDQSNERNEISLLTGGSNGVVVLSKIKSRLFEFSDHLFFKGFDMQSRSEFLNELILEEMDECKDLLKFCCHGKDFFVFRSFFFV